MIKSVLFCFLVLFLTSCLPAYKEFNKIHKKPFEDNLYDSSDKSCDFALKLIEMGYEAQVWILLGEYGKNNTAIVFAEIDGKDLYFDPTNGVVYNEQLDDWVPIMMFKGRSTIQLVRKDELFYTRN